MTDEAPPEEAPATPSPRRSAPSEPKVIGRCASCSGRVPLVAGMVCEHLDRPNTICAGSGQAPAA